MYSAVRGIDGLCVASPASILPFSLLASSFLERMNEVATLMNSISKHKSDEKISTGGYSGLRDCIE